MEFNRVTPPEARDLVENEDYVLLDVRSIPEFEAGHAPGAYNIPLLHRDGEAMVSNSDFEAVVGATFPDTKQKIVTYCGMGGRSMRAARTLGQLGYGTVVDIKGGFLSEKGDAGSVINEGWVDSDLPTESGDGGDKAYQVLAAKALQPQTPAAEATTSASSEAPAGISDGEGMNRFASAQHRVLCHRLGRELPGLKRRPYPGELGERLFAEISALAWNEWVEHSKILINEYRIVTTDPKSMNMLYEECDRFFFGQGATVPDEFVAPK